MVNRRLGIEALSFRVLCRTNRRDQDNKQLCARLLPLLGHEANAMRLLGALAESESVTDFRSSSCSRDQRVLAVEIPKWAVYHHSNWETRARLSRWPYP